MGAPSSRGTRGSPSSWAGSPGRNRGAGAARATTARPGVEGRIPSGAIPGVDSLTQFASRGGPPTEPLIQKALEGGAKHVAGRGIIAAVQVSLGQLRDARALLVRAGDQPPVLPAEM